MTHDDQTYEPKPHAPLGYEPVCPPLDHPTARGILSDLLAGGKIAILIEAGSGRVEIWMRVADGFPPSHMVAD